MITVYQGPITLIIPTGVDTLQYLSKTQATNDTGAVVVLEGGATGGSVRGYIGYAHTGSGADTLFTGEIADAVLIRCVGAFQLGTNGDNIRISVLANGTIKFKPLSSNGLMQVSGGDGTLSVAGTDTPTTDPGWATSSTVNMNVPDTYIKVTIGAQDYVIPAWVT